MRCLRCQFENIPGQARCIRCGSVLEAAAVAVEVHPPRMPAWHRPWRGVTRWLRGHRVSISVPLPGTVRRRAAIASDSVLGLLLNVVPGLAHLVTGRFRQVRLYVALWLVVLALGVLSYGSTLGSVLIGLAIGIHAWIALHDEAFRKITDLAERIGAVLIVVVLLTILYWATPRVVFPGFAGGHTTFAIPAMNVHRGDYLLVRRLEQADTPLTRGTLVLIRPDTFRDTRRVVVRDQRSFVIGQIVGLPGETVRIANRRYVVAEQPLDPGQFPVPQWLQDYPLTQGGPVPADSYFISTEYTVSVHGRAMMNDAAIREACTIRASDIRGRAFLRWWPWERRGFIE